MKELLPDPRSYLPSRIRACPRCRDTSQVQVMIFGMPSFPPQPEEEDRVYFVGCVWPNYDKNPKWRCPACEIVYTGRGEVVSEIESW